MEQGKKLLYSELTGKILNCCFEVMKELGPGFVESIYKNALLIAMRQKGLKVEVERSYEVMFRGVCIGRYIPVPPQTYPKQTDLKHQISNKSLGLILN